MKKGVATVAQLFDFDEIVDTRSPAEFAEDRIPGAINCPVLDDAQRARVGTIYKQISPFEARRLGGALVAENIARHLHTHFMDKPQSWRPWSTAGEGVSAAAVLSPGCASSAGTLNSSKAATRPSAIWSSMN